MYTVFEYLDNSQATRRDLYIYTSLIYALSLKLCNLFYFQRNMSCYLFPKLSCPSYNRMSTTTTAVTDHIAGDELC